MKNRFLLYLAFSSLFLSCKKDNPVQPQEQIDEKLATKTIDATGGSISTDNYILTVPPGAFDGAFQLSLSLLASNHLLVISDIDNIYRLVFQGTDPTAALISTVKGLKAVWWPEFFKYYINGEIYNVPGSFFVKKTCPANGILIMPTIQHPSSNRTNQMLKNIRIFPLKCLSSIKMFRISIREKACLWKSPVRQQARV
ncbi:hypothetical protein JW935_23535 [candidate division KSB1 bacterium]|nr:hypothetical protein [candidate division KSB1 bacterium]